MSNRILSSLLGTFLLGAMATTFTSCETATSPTTQVVDTTTVTTGGRELFIVSEGQFLHSNGSLDVLQYDHIVSIHDSASVSDTTVVDSIHERRDVLTGLGLGNDILIAGNKAIVLDNGSNDLIIVNADSLNTIATIPMGTSAPSKMALISPTQVLVTQRSSDSVAILDLSSNMISGYINIGEPSIAVAVLNGNAIVTSATASYSAPYHINVIDVATETRTMQYTIAGSPEQAVADSANDQIIVGTPGDYASVPARFYFLNASGTLTDSTTVGGIQDDAELIQGSQKFVIKGTNVYRPMGTTHQLGAKVSSIDSAYYRGYYDAVTNSLYFGFAGDFTNPGHVDVFDATSGTLKASYPTGIAPGHFAFYH